MKTLVVQSLRSRWFVASFHAGLWLLLYFIASNLGGRAPQFGDGTSPLPSPQKLPPVAKLDPLFNKADWPKSVAQTNLVDAFYTRYFIPPPAPAPPPPTTRKIELVYQGFYKSANGQKQVIVKQADAFLVTSIGSRLTANLYAADASMLSLVLTNPAAVSNIVLLNAKKEIEVPIQ